MGAAGFSFRNDAAGLFYYDCVEEDVELVADTGTTYPGSGNPVTAFSLPAMAECTIAFRAFGLGGERGALTYGALGAGLTERAPYLSSESRPLVTRVDGASVYSWRGTDPVTFGGQIVVSDDVSSQTYVSAGDLVDDGNETLDALNDLAFLTLSPISFRNAGARGVCVGFQGSLQSSPFVTRLLRTCDVAPGERRTEILLSPGDPIADSTVVSWDIGPDAAVGTDLVLVANLSDGTRALVAIRDEPKSDADGDGVSDAADNCILVANADQRDADGDGIGSVCDADLNNDCVVNAIDLGLFRSVLFGSDANADFNGDGTVNVVDLGLLRGLFFDVPGPSRVPNVCNGD